MAYTGEGSNCRNSMDPPITPNPTEDTHGCNLQEIVVMKKHGSNTEYISQAVLRLGTELWRLRAPLTFLHVTSGIEPPTLFPEPLGH